jgi:hypothetical protein
MPVYKRTKMCAECPFRADAPRGWLGPLTVEDLMKTVHGATKIGPTYVGDMGDMICHMDLLSLPKKLTQDQIIEQGQMCVGMVRYTNSICKRSRRPELAEFQDKLSQVEDVPTIPPGKLREYHTLETGEKTACRVTFKKDTASRTEKYDILLNGEKVGHIRNRGPRLYYYRAEVGDFTTNTSNDLKSLKDCKAAAKKFCQDYSNS